MGLVKVPQNRIIGRTLLVRFDKAFAAGATMPVEALLAFVDHLMALDGRAWASREWSATEWRRAQAEAAKDDAGSAKRRAALRVGAVLALASCVAALLFRRH